MGQHVVQCSVLGRTEITTQGIRLTPESERQYGMALYFCVNAGRAVPRDEVAQLFWPEHEIEAARHCLRQTLYRVRALGVPVRSGSKTSTLDAQSVETDYGLAAADGAPASVYLGLSDVTVLPGYTPRFSTPFAEWVERFRSDLGSRIRRDLVRAIADARSRGRYADVERLARHCLTLDPLNEEATLALAEAVALVGGKVEAVGMIDRYLQEVGRHPREMRLPSLVLRERVADTIVGSQLALREPPLIGRRYDLERIVTQLQRLAAGAGLSYVLRGDPGIGKTRLSDECCRIAHLQGVSVVRLTIPASGRAHCLSTVGEVVSTVLRLPGALGTAPEALTCLRSFSEGGDVEDTAMVVRSDDRSKHALLRWSLFDLLDSVLAERPLLINLDDAHNLDSASRLLLEDVQKQFMDRPLGLLLAARAYADMCASDAFRRSQSTGIVHHLEPLSDIESYELVEVVCREHQTALSEDQRQRIVQLAGGNPLFILELLRHRRDLTDRSEAALTIQTIVERRLAVVSLGALRALQSCAVLGPLATPARIEAVARDEAIDVVGAIGELESAGLITLVAEGVTCRHELIREVVLKSVPAASRRLLHRRVAALIGSETLRTRTVTLLWECVHHWKEGGTPERGLDVVVQLARRLLALGHAEEALRILDEVNASCSSLRDRARLLRWIVRAHGMLRNWTTFERVVDRYRLLRQRANRDSPRHDFIELLEYEARLMMGVEESETFDRMLACVAGDSANIQHRLDAAVLALAHADNQGRPDVSTRVHEKVRALVPTGARANIAQLTAIMIFEASTGTPTLAAQAADRLARLASACSHPVTRAQLLRRCAYTYRRVGSIERAVAVAAEAYAIAARLELKAHELAALDILAHAALDVGDVDGTLRWLRAARHAAAGQSGVLVGVPYCIESRLAFETANPEFLPTTSPSLCSDLSPPPPRRSQQIILASIAANRILKKQGEGLRDVLSHLRSLHLVLCAQGLQDFAVGTLVAGLTCLAERSHALAILRNYLLRERRESTPPPHSLIRLREQLSVPVSAP